MAFGLLGLALIAGCSSRTSETPRPDADVLHFDAAMLARPDGGSLDDADIPGDAGQPDAGPPSCTASMSADGVLTNHPEATFRNLGGPLVLRTAYIDVIERPTLTSFIMFGEVENTGTTIQCTPLPDLYVSYLRLYPTVEGPPAIQSGTVSSTCIPPGGRGVLFAIENDVSPSILEPLTLVEYAMDSRAPFGAVDTTANPLIETSEVRMTSTGLVIGGTARTFVPIENVSIEFFGRNACGLVYSSWTAYPEDFETTRVGTFEFETFPETFDQLEIPVSWVGFASYIRS